MSNQVYSRDLKIHCYNDKNLKTLESYCSTNKVQIFLAFSLNHTH